MNLDHPTEQELLQFADGDLSDVRFEQIASHLEICDRCVEFLHKPGVFPKLATGDDSTEFHEPISERPGSVIGPYKLLQKLGEGGMGVVYMAEQEEPVRRKVALKIIKPGMDSRQVIARFEAERQALAMMEHHHIAKVFGAGTTDTGRPFFAMELVKGIPMTDYCDRNKLNLRERLELFVPVCHAIQHAHHKGIIHRDIKPTNVLVTLYDGTPVPMVIDFGIAKATQQKLTERTMFTAVGQILGTPEYMSPEQAELNQLDIDTRSDVYSLGVLLYELLTGSTPITKEQLADLGFEEMLRTIRETDPPKPSTRLSESTSVSPSISAVRRVDSAKLPALVRDELDWIVMKALEKDRTRRYETANGLAMDLERYLNDEPVVACPPSATYRLRKFARRYKTAIGTTAAVAIILVVATITSLWFAYATLRARAENEVRLSVQQLLDCDTSDVHVHLNGVKRHGESARTQLRDRLSNPLPRREKLHAVLALSANEDAYVEDLCHLSIDASPDEARAIATALRAHRSEKLSNWMESAAKAPYATPEERIRRLGMLALYDPDHKRLLSAQSFIDLLLDLDPAPSIAWIQLLKPFDEAIQAEAREAFSSERTSQRGVVAARLLAYYLQHQPMRLAQYVVVAAPEQLSELIPFLTPDHETLQFLNRVAQMVPKDAVVLSSPEFQESCINGANDVVRLRIEFDQFPKIVADLHRHGYCLSSFSVYGTDDDRRVAAVWMLADAKCDLIWDVTPADLQRLAEQKNKEGLEVVLSMPLGENTPGTDVRLAALCIGADSNYYRMRWKNQAISGGLDAGFGESVSQEAGTEFVLRSTEFPTHRLRFYWNGVAAIKNEDLESMYAVPPTIDEEDASIQVAESGPIIQTPSLPLHAYDEFTIEAIVSDWSGPLCSQGTISNRESALWLSVGNTVLSVRGFGWLGKNLAPAIHDSMRTSRVVGKKHIALVYEKMTYRLYLEGKQVTAGTAEKPFPFASTSRFMIGGQLRNFIEMADWRPKCGNGRLHELRVSSVARYRGEFEPTANWSIDSNTKLALRAERAPVGARRVTKSDGAVRLLGVAVHDRNRQNELFETLRKRGFVPISCQVVPDSENIQLFSTWTYDTAIGGALRLNAALALLASGQTTPCLDYFDSSDAIQEHDFVQVACKALDDPAPVLNLLRQGLRKNDEVVYRALLAIGEFPFSAISPAQQTAVVQALESIWKNHSDSGIHAAVESVCRRWGIIDGLRPVQSNVQGNWTINREGHRLVAVTVNENFEKYRALPQQFAVAAHEVTVEQFGRFDETICVKGRPANSQQPVAGVSLQHAARYCNWLSKQEGLAPEEWCFVESADSDSLLVPSNYQSRTGYRLPTNDEWSYACGLGESRKYAFGDDAKLLPEYGWFALNRRLRPDLSPIGMLKPSRLGLFDVHGNVAEWSIAKTSPANEVLSEHQASLRGGCIESVDPLNLRITDPGDDVPASLRGFRIVRTLRPASQEDEHANQLWFRISNWAKDFTKEVVWTDSISSVSDGKGHGPVEPRNKIRKHLVGRPDGRFFSMGCDGGIVLEFEAIDCFEGPGYDLVIAEMTFDPNERLGVSISRDQTNWVDIGTVVGGVTLLDAAGFVEPGYQIRYVKLIDLSSDYAPTSPGCDVDAVGAFHAKWREGTSILAGRTVDELAVFCKSLTWGDAVESLEPGVGTKLSATNPEDTLGPPDYEFGDTQTYCTLGYKAQLIVKFNQPFVDGTGPDLVVVEAGSSADTADVAVSSDGLNWIELGTAKTGVTLFDLGNVVPPDARFQFVRVIGSTQARVSDGFDLDALAVCYSQDE